MPLTRISLRSGKSQEYKKHIAENIYEALREIFNIGEDDIFTIFHEHEENNFIYGENYFDIHRTDDLLLIQITVSNTRTIEQKKLLYKKIVELLVKAISIRPEDIFINLLEVAKENWSFGNGIAQYA
jgi:phenylpyruvate tautomerase PptA (4-oxalocrotonate tautomerase family)